MLVSFCKSFMYIPIFPFLFIILNSKIFKFYSLLHRGHTGLKCSNNCLFITFTRNVPYYFCLIFTYILSKGGLWSQVSTSLTTILILCVTSILGSHQHTDHVGWLSLIQIIRIVNINGILTSGDDKLKSEMWSFPTCVGLREIFDTFKYLSYGRRASCLGAWWRLMPLKNLSSHRTGSCWRQSSFSDLVP